MEDIDIKTQKNREACKRWRDKNKEREKIRQAQWIKDNKDHVNKRNQKWREENPDKYKQSQKRSHRNRTCESQLLEGAKYRAKKKGLDFSLTIEDIIIPSHCSVLGTSIILPDTSHPDYDRDKSPSIDRFDNSKGYTRDNIRIISYRANAIKGDATREELEAVLKYVSQGA